MPDKFYPCPWIWEVNFELFSALGDLGQGQMHKQMNFSEFSFDAIKPFILPHKCLLVCSLPKKCLLVTRYFARH